MKKLENILKNNKQFMNLVVLITLLFLFAIGIYGLVVSDDILVYIGFGSVGATFALVALMLAYNVWRTNNTMIEVEKWWAKNDKEFKSWWNNTETLRKSKDSKNILIDEERRSAIYNLTNDDKFK